MRNVIFGINITLDGCCDHTKFNPDEELMDYFTHLTRDADTFLYGRITYQLMVPYWPDVAKDHSGQRKAEMLGLIDEYHFVVHPIVSGEGRRLFDGINLQEKLQLKLVESKIFKSGCVALRYLKQ